MPTLSDFQTFNLDLQIMNVTTSNQNIYTVKHLLIACFLIQVVLYFEFTRFPAADGFVLQELPLYNMIIADHLKSQHRNAISNKTASSVEKGNKFGEQKPKQLKMSEINENNALFGAYAAAVEEFDENKRRGHYRQHNYWKLWKPYHRAFIFNMLNSNHTTVDETLKKFKKGMIE